MSRKGFFFYSIFTLCVLLTISAANSINRLNSNLDTMPLLPDEDLDMYSHQVGCMFGGVQYDIDSQWHPVLEPYGVMYCLKCTCNAVIKKGLLQQRGQVVCKSITDQCPDVSSCPQTPVLPPNSCCKICPQDEDSQVSKLSPLGRQARLDTPSSSYLHSSIRIGHQSASSNDLNSRFSRVSSLQDRKEFSVLLSRTTTSTANIVGKAHIVFDTTVLKMTIELSSNPVVSKVRLAGKGGKLYFEQKVTNAEVSGGITKLCVSWRDAYTYAKELVTGETTLIITSENQNQDILEGPLLLARARVLETFSALMIDSYNQGYAAQLSMGLDVSSDSLNIRGSLALPSLSGKHSITLEILRDRRVIWTSNIMLAVNQQRAEFSVIWANLNTSNMKQLARGRLSARISLLNGTTVYGMINTFQMCGNLKALVTGADAVPQYETTGVAVANFSLKSNGDLHYQVEILDVESRITEIVIETDRHSSTELPTKITRIAKDINDRAIVTLSGIYDKPDAKEIQLLLEGKLFVNIATRLASESSMRGQILIVPTRQQDYILMRDKKTGMASQAWCDTTECSLLCNMLVPRNIVRHDGLTQAFLDYWDQKQLLATFTESNLVEFIVAQNEVQQISSTLPTLRLVTRDTTLYGQVVVPKTCFDDRYNELLPAGDEEVEKKGPWIDPNLELAHKCSYDGKIYSDGESWKPKDSTLECVTCSCKRNKVQCYPVVCPAVTCANPVMLPGECCPACPNPAEDTSKTCFFPGDHREHKVGTVWHPFMHPGGYFKCAVCFCKDGGNGYDCKATECPVLDCHESLQERRSGDCCPTCKDPEPLGVASGNELSMMQGDSNSYSQCKVGKNTYLNGESFSPEIGPFGTYDNIICACQNGKVDCKRIECDCASKKSRRNRCCMKQCGYSEADMIKRKKKKERKWDKFC